jgi:CDP-glycerol glycerophosphotransferase (TagB/SpsB family)
MVYYIFLKIVCIPLLRLLDFFVPKNDKYYGFAVHHIKSDQFIENARAVYEYIKGDSTIKKIIFCREELHDFNIEDGLNTEILRLNSVKGLFLFIRCKVLFVTHSISMDYSIRFSGNKFLILNLSLKNRLVINLWHGIPFKRLYALWNPLVKNRLDRVSYRRYERKMYSGLISTSDVDSFSMGTMFYPIKYENVWITGIPRNDYLLKSLDSLPTYLKNEVVELRLLKGDKKLILYAPTYRQTKAVNGANYYQFSDVEILELLAFLKTNNAVLGVRLHYFRNDNVLFNIEKYIDNEFIFDLGHSNYTEISGIIRESDVIISDYSSIFIDSLYLDKPVLCFAYDFNSYESEQDGILYDLNLVFPGPVSRSFLQLINDLQSVLTYGVDTEKYKFSKNFFYKYIDESNSKRVIDKLNSILDGGE